MVLHSFPVEVWDRQQDTARSFTEPPATELPGELSHGLGDLILISSHPSAPHSSQFQQQVLPGQFPMMQPLISWCCSPSAHSSSVLAALGITHFGCRRDHQKFFPRQTNKSFMGHPHFPPAAQESRESEVSLQAPGPEMDLELLDFHLSPNPRTPLLEQAHSFLLPHQCQ